jgi:hypothetical protein
MDLVPATVGVNASGRCIVRGQRLARVKFVALPADMAPGNVREAPRLGECRVSLFPGGRNSIRKFVLRVIGRLVAARP